MFGTSMASAELDRSDWVRRDSIGCFYKASNVAGSSSGDASEDHGRRYMFLGGTDAKSLVTGACPFYLTRS